MPPTAHAVGRAGRRGGHRARRSRRRAAGPPAPRRPAPLPLPDGRAEGAVSAAARSSRLSRLCNRPELVHVGQEGADAGRLRREALVAEQGVQPYEPPARLPQAVRLGPETFAGVAVEPVGDEQHHRALAAYPAGPLPVEPIEALPDPGASAPVLHLPARPLDRRVHVAVPELAGDVGEPGAEDEREHPPAVAITGEGVCEMEQHPRVSAHRARDVAEHHDRGGPPHLAPAREQDRPGPGPETAPEGGPQVDARAVWMRAVAAGRGGRDGEPQPGDRRLGRGQLRGRHLLEVPRPQDLPVRPGEGGLEFHLLLGLPRLRAAFAAREERLAQPTAERLRVAAGRRLHGGEEEARDPFEEPRVAPEDVEGLVEEGALVTPPDEDRVQRPVEVVPAREPCRLDRPQRVEDRAAPDGEAGRPQGAGEVHEVGGEAARRHGVGAAEAGARSGPRCGSGSGPEPGYARGRIGGRHVLHDIGCEEARPGSAVPARRRASMRAPRLRGFRGTRAEEEVVESSRPIPHTPGTDGARIREGGRWRLGRTMQGGRKPGRRGPLGVIIPPSGWPSGSLR